MISLKVSNGTRAEITPIIYELSRNFTGWLITSAGELLSVASWEKYGFPE